MRIKSLATRTLKPGLHAVFGLILLLAYAGTATAQSCTDISGSWSVTEVANLTAIEDGDTEQVNQSGTQTVEISQTGCSVSYNVPTFDGGTATRTGTVTGDQVVFSGVAVPTLEALTCSRNAATATGSTTGSQINLITSVDVECTDGSSSITVTGGGTADFVRSGGAGSGGGNGGGSDTGGGDSGGNGTTASATALFQLNDPALGLGEQVVVDFLIGGTGQVDIYLALLLPNEDFVTITSNSPLAISAPNQVLPFRTSETLTPETRFSILNLPISTDIPQGSYKFVAAVVPAGGDVLNTANWISTGEIFFSVFHQ